MQGRTLQFSPLTVQLWVLSEDFPFSNAATQRLTDALPPNASQGMQWPKESCSIAEWLQLQDGSKHLHLLTSAPEI
jgi:hypothetical protein